MILKTQDTCKSSNIYINEYYEIQTEASKIRSRVKHFEKGEKSTKYFSNLEKPNVINKVWTKVKCIYGTLNSDKKVYFRGTNKVVKEVFNSERMHDIDADPHSLCVLCSKLCVCRDGQNYFSPVKILMPHLPE